MNNLWLLAEVAPNTPSSQGKIVSEPINAETAVSTVTAAPNTPAPAQKQQQPSTPWSGYILLIAMFVLLYFMMFRGPKKKQQQQRQMIESLKKNDRVQTIGGILGTVLDVKDDEVTLKIDESTNTKVKVVAGAISKVLSEDKK